MTHDDDALAVEVNRLYWDTDTSVGDITGQLDISRRALYELIRPEGADAECPECGSLMVYTNRSARDRRDAACPACDAEGDAAAAAGLPPSVEQEARGADLSPLDAEEAYQRSRAVLMGSAALAGMIVGAAATWLIGRRD